MATIVVTGGLGFIGSHTVVELIQKQYEVVIIDNLSNTTLEVLNGIENITGVRPEVCIFDLTDARAVHRFFEQHPNIDGIIHFAAYKAVGESVQHPIKYYENNLFSLINLLKVSAQAQRPLPFIFSSSCTVYGEATTLPINENTPLLPAASPYGNTKQICEEILQDTAAASDAFKMISLRYFNPIGAHPSLAIGELPFGKPQNLVPFITQTAAGVLEELTVFGDDYSTPDGTCIRDYIDVVDLAKAHVAALQLLETTPDAKNYEVFNLGTGKGTSVLEVIHTFEAVANLSLPYRIGNRRSGDVEAIYADTQKANTLLGWYAETPLATSIHHAWLWEQKIRALQGCA